jgi:O-antigen/teichoic acid export membrane protein
LMVAVVVPLAHLVLPHLGPYSKIAPLALPISVQAAIYLLQIPFSAAMRGMQQGPLLFVQYVCFSATSLTGLVVGARHGHVESAAWGLTTGAAVGLAVMIILYGAAVRRLAPDSGHPEPDDAPMPDPVTEAG